jgi:hypothetical protein
MLQERRRDERRPPDLLLQPMPVHTGSGDEDGRLVLADGRLVAVLVRLGEASHGDMVGAWFLEVGFGPCAHAPARLFKTLDIAQNWIRGQLGT